MSFTLLGTENELAEFIMQRAKIADNMTHDRVKYAKRDPGVD